MLGIHTVFQQMMTPYAASCQLIAGDGAICHLGGRHLVVGYFFRGYDIVLQVSGLNAARF
ncbi:hypothetical protein D3C76_1781880 [compost metagenome]